MVEESCKHVTLYRNRNGGPPAFSRLRLGLLSLWKKDIGLQERLRQTERTPIICLLCACASPTCTHHQQQHYAMAKNGHELAVDLQHDQLFCAACNAHVQDAAVYAAIKAARASSWAVTEPNTTAAPSAMLEFSDSAQAMPALLKRKRSHTGYEHPPSKKAKQLKQEKLNAPAVALQHNSMFAAGLRGLNNLGNTCFMNSILQVFVHVPLLRAYFLGGGHMHKLCPHLTPPDRPGKCLSCELDNIFSEAYSGHQVPFSPVRFLDTWWRSAGGSLAGYQQQDAHEFYLSLLDGLSQQMDRTTTPSASGSPSAAPRAKSLTPTSADMDSAALNSAPSFNAWGLAGPRPPQHSAVIDLATSSSSGLDSSSQSREEEDIESTMDQTFGGILRSDVVCATCGYTSTAHDPFKDISVDIPEPPPHIPQPPPVDTPKPNLIKGSAKGGKGSGKGTNGKGGGKGGKTGMAGVKRGAEALFQKDWENTTEASEPALSDASAFPATTEASIRCSSVDDQSSVAGHVDCERDQTVSSPLHTPARQSGSPTPDPFDPHAPRMTYHLKPASAAASASEAPPAAGRSNPSAKSAAQSKHSVPATETPEAAAEAVQGSEQGSIHTFLQGQGSGKGPTVGQGFAQGPGKRKGPAQGQRPSTAPASPAAATGKIVKPSRCQKCHTCRHKQLKKQCLRNKALSSPTKKNIEDALHGGVEAAELTDILPSHLQPLDARLNMSRHNESAAAAAQPARLAPVLHSSKHRQAALFQHNRPAPLSPSAQSQGPGGHSNASRGLGRTSSMAQGPGHGQDQMQGPGKMQRESLGSRSKQGWIPEGTAEQIDPVTAETSQAVGIPHAWSEGPVPSPPPPLPVRADPSCHPNDGCTAQQPALHHHQQQQQQQQQQYASLQQSQQVAMAGTDMAQQASQRLQQSVSEQEVREVETGAGGSSGVLLQACLHRFVRPETLHRWTCSRCECQRSATKQMSIRQLPPVLCLHLKRFKATDKGATKKVESRVAFPVSQLDMAPFTSAAVLASRCHLKSALSGQSGRAATEAGVGSTAYRLHAVVCHTGNLLGGHYIGYVRCGAHWYQFDDARVTLVPEQYVRLSNAYMLFYLQQ